MTPDATFTTGGHEPVLIEDWLPIRELSVESVRERRAPSALPPLSFFHVWWARAPLAAASGITLAALLPLWDDALLDKVTGLGDALQRVRNRRKDLREVADEMSASDWYRAWVLWLCGVWGDTVTAQSAYDAAKVAGKRIPNPFTWSQAYQNKPRPADLTVLHRLLEHRWGRLPCVLDPTAGGGSIPFTSMRYGLPTHANDLNPVAVGILDTSLRAASEYGPDAVEDLKELGAVLTERLRERLEHFFPSRPVAGEQVATYLWTNTVACPRTGGPVPLAPNWWLSKKGDGTAVRPIPVRNDDGSPSHIRYEILQDPESHGFDPNDGTVSRGTAVSPWDDAVVDGDWIKSEAQAGRMWATLYAVRYENTEYDGRGSDYRFRKATATDLDAVAAAEAELERLLPQWDEQDVLPKELVPHGNDQRPHHYGMGAWRAMFTPRQLLVHGAFIEEWRLLLSEVREAYDDRDRADGVMALLAMMQNKALNYNARLSNWHPTRDALANVFARHDFSFSWTFGEFEGAQALWSWCLDQLLDAYGGIAELIQPAPVEHDGLVGQSDHLEQTVPAGVILSARSATDLPHIDDESIELVNIDPPYYDNVQYAELADFFYVWEKRTLGLLHPDWFSDELTNKDAEAVANPARFEDAGRRKKELATFDYQQKMQAIFAECRRVLTDDGVMVVWFTHKKAEAWDTLGTAMMDAGFTIEASWPVATQSSISLHHAKKNSAKSTVMLVCRKRSGDSDGVFFEDIEADVRRAAVAAVEKFEDEVGVGGVDLLLSTYGPTLSVIAQNWPVLSSEADESGRARRLQPEEALAVAREEVNRLVKQRLVGRGARFDAPTDFWLFCWATFEAREFPYDEARKLGMSAGYGVDEAIDVGLLRKKSGNVVLEPPAKRAKSLRRKADDRGRFDTLVDALHHLLNTYEQDGLAAARTWLADSGYADETAFTQTVQAAVNAVPRVRGKKGLTLDEAEALEAAVVALFDESVELPEEAAEDLSPEQLELG